MVGCLPRRSELKAGRTATRVGGLVLDFVGFILQPSLCQKASVAATRVRLITAEIAGHVADPGHIIARAFRGEHGA